MRTGNLLFPKDGKAGGSWFAIHENGQTLILLNGAETRHHPQPPYRQSRGLILLELADSNSPLQSFRKIDLAGIEPFTIILLEDGRLHECRWDGNRKYHKNSDAITPHIWSSVTLYSPGIIARRRQWFEDWMDKNPNPGPEEILQFHRFNGDGDKANAILMNRDDRLLTVSITALQLDSKKAGLCYFDLASDQSFRQDLVLKKANPIRYQSQTLEKE
jgi:hypothetical protein